MQSRKDWLFLIVIHYYRTKKLCGIRRGIVTAKNCTFPTLLTLCRWISSLTARYFASKERRAKYILEDIRCHYSNDSINDTRGVRYSFELPIIRWIRAYFRSYASPKSEKDARGAGEKLESSRNFHAAADNERIMTGSYTSGNRWKKNETAREWLRRAEEE